jgi:hypothetical protein
VNLEALRTEFLARGFDYLSSTRADGYLNDAYLLDICEEEDWPFLEATATGAAPLTLSDLRAIEYVTDLTQPRKLDPLKRARIADDWSTDLTQTGSPSLYYVTKGTTVNVFPVAADEIEVLYWKVPTALTGTANPLLPDRFHSLIVDGAVARAYEDSDDYELAQAASSRFEARLERMRTSLGMSQHDAPDDYIVVEDPAALH